MPVFKLSRNKALLPALLIIMLTVVPAQAHKIKLFAMVEGKAVNGYAYAPGGVRLPNNIIEIYDGNRKKVGETKTDANGEFSFTPKERSNLSFELDTGDGHRTTFLISSDELAADLPAATAKQAAIQTDAPAPPPATPPTPTVAAPAELAAMIDQAVAHNLRPLREQIEAYEQKIRLHDILGGIGYIMGLAGIFAYLQAGKKEKDRPGGV